MPYFDIISNLTHNITIFKSLNNNIIFFIYFLTSDQLILHISGKDLLSWGKRYYTLALFFCDYSTKLASFEKNDIEITF